MPEKITYEQVRQWIIENSKNQEQMDDINKLTYVFTSKYAEQQKRG